jgi:hypothetical protein
MSRLRENGNLFQAYKKRLQRGRDHAANRAQHPVVRLTPSSDEFAVGLEDALTFRERMIPNAVEDQVKPRVAPRKILFGVVDYMIGADRADQV